MKLIVSTLIALLLAGAVYAGINVNALMQMCVKPRGVDGFNFDFLNLILKLNYSIIVNNKSALAVDINGYYFDVLLDNKNIGNVSSSNKKVLAGNTSSILSIPISIKIGSAVGELFSSSSLQNFSARRYDKVIVTLNGKFEGVLMGIPIAKNITFAYSLQDLLSMANAPAQEC